ncbi:uncharacterized protein LOC127880692 [Dreissena polymorpha]|nr:uncharacterized protein LOC127880692 [Dreissena polymorpha]
MEASKEYIEAGHHLFSSEEQAPIIEKLEAAMTLINRTIPQLYRAIHQTIACIAFYKAEYPGFAGGTVSSALGIIWQDPRAYREHSVPYYAEAIVHEYLHMSLFLADLVHGTYKDRKLLAQTKVYSPIRRKLRDFDKTFHASYVSTGVTVFHARGGNWDKAKHLAESLRTSVDGLVEINNAVGVLNESGEAMLRAMDDFLSVIRLKA